jgi:hypothetical protein
MLLAILHHLNTVLVEMMIDVHGPEDAREMMGLNVIAQCKKASGDATTMH